MANARISTSLALRCSFHAGHSPMMWMMSSGVSLLQKMQLGEAYMFFLAEYNRVAPRALEVDVALVTSRNCKVLELDAGVGRETPC